MKRGRPKQDVPFRLALASAVVAGSVPCLAAAGAGSAVVQASGTQTLAAATQMARADAARRTGLAVEAIEVVGAEPVTWRDGSLGCPQPGRMYTQALVAGYRIRLRASGQELDYHAGVRGSPVFCPQGSAQDPLPGDARR